MLERNDRASSTTALQSSTLKSVMKNQQFGPKSKPLRHYSEGFLINILAPLGISPVKTCLKGWGKKLVNDKNILFVEMIWKPTILEAQKCHIRDFSSHPSYVQFLQADIGQD